MSDDDDQDVREALMNAADNAVGESRKVRGYIVAILMEDGGHHILKQWGAAHCEDCGEKMDRLHDALTAAATTIDKERH